MVKIPWYGKKPMVKKPWLTMVIVLWYVKNSMVWYKLPRLKKPWLTMVTIPWYG